MEQEGFEAETSELRAALEADAAPAAAGELPVFEAGRWRPEGGEYGLTGLLRLREGMGQIEQPEELATLKFLVIPGAPAPAEEERRAPESRLGDRKGKGKGKGKDKEPTKGRYVKDHGQTQVLHETQRGQWWRNAESSDVVVRRDISLMSDEIFRVPPGHFVQQAGPAEAFITDQAKGLRRMPVLPHGWVTVDATAVGGPRYLVTIRRPTWRVCFSSGSGSGDVVVRAGLSLESDLVAALMKGTQVEQSGPQELEDGIVRMPVVFAEGAGLEPGDLSQPSRKTKGWVTCDASPQGGPKFFEPLPDAAPAPRPTPTPPRREAADGAGGEDAPAGSGPPRDKGDQAWKRNKMWTVTNAPQVGGLGGMPVLMEAEPWAPGSDAPPPPEDTVVRWLSNGDTVEQVGHSKKVHGYMVMPIRCLRPGEDADGKGETAAEGWVTRRLVDKERARGGQHVVWFDEAVGARGAARAPPEPADKGAGDDAWAAFMAK